MESSVLRTVNRNRLAHASLVCLHPLSKVIIGGHRLACISASPVQSRSTLKPLSECSRSCCSTSCPLMTCASFTTTSLSRLFPLIFLQIRLLLLPQLQSSLVALTFPPASYTPPVRCLSPSPPPPPIPSLPRQSKASSLPATSSAMASFSRESPFVSFPTVPPHTTTGSQRMSLRLSSSSVPVAMQSFISFKKFSPVHSHQKTVTCPPSVSWSSTPTGLLPLPTSSMVENSLSNAYPKPTSTRRL